MVVRISLPMGRLTSASHNHAGSAASGARFCFNGRGEMHGRCDPAKNPLGMVNEANQFAQIRFASKIDYSLKLRMKMPDSADLNKLNFAAEMVDDVLIALSTPPLNSNIVFTARSDDPERKVDAGEFMDLREPGFLLRGEMNVSVESGRLDGQLKPFVEKGNKTVECVIRTRVAVVYEGIGTLN